MQASDPTRLRGYTRRQMLALGSGTALALLLGQAVRASTPLTVDDFAVLSARLLDKDVDLLEGEHVSAYYENLVDQGEADALVALIEGGENPSLEQRILTQWYTGLQQTRGGEQVVTYTDAQLWQALDYTKPMGWCGGATGYWGDAPAGEA